MGISIAEMLGMELPDDDLATLKPDGESDIEIVETRNEGEKSKESLESGGEPDDVEEAVVAALLNETSVPAEKFSPQLTLRTDFDLDNIGLYAVIAEIEQELSIEIPDAEIEKTMTLSDLFVVVRSHKTSSSTG
ncbi:MAG: acyl carrier protein [Actinomycetaceae bacterium]|nr:acyl carrier protein [Actinomycetaceae bacterium]